MQSERPAHHARERKNPVRSETERMIDAVRKQTLERRLDRAKRGR